MLETKKMLNEDQMARVENYGAMGGKIKNAYHCQIEETQMECIEIHYFNRGMTEIFNKDSINLILNGIKLERNKA